MSETSPSLRRYATTGQHDEGLLAFLAVRPRLFGIAYHMLGSAAEAEDVVQDVWIRWQSSNRSMVENPPAFLVTTTTRLCINSIQSAHSRHETYAGAWLPDPVDTTDDPGISAERGEALQLAVMLLLEKLTPTERAAYVLREAFDYSYSQISDILRMEQANVRQLVSRAHKHIADGRRACVGSGEQRRLREAFLAAAQKGEMDALEGLFQEGMPEFKNSPMTFEGSQAKASEYLNSPKKTARLLAGVWSKARCNYDALLSVWESLHILARMVRAWITGRYSAPVISILAALAALIYFVEPFDLIPDGVPVFGLLDDVLIITFVVQRNLKEINKFRNWETLSSSGCVEGTMSEKIMRRASRFTVASASPDSLPPNPRTPGQA